MTYLILKWLHIVSATVLFGTGIGTAYQMWMAYRGGEPVVIAHAARTTVSADWWFTASSGIVQPVTGFLLIWLTGRDPLSGWLLASYALFLLAFACWLPVVRIQLMVRDQMAGATSVPESVHRAMRRWFLLGWPAFIALTTVLYLMVAKPSL
jgi:uncharacterized membrane protein